MAKPTKAELFRKVVPVVKNLLENTNRLECTFDDPRIKGILGGINNAHVRTELARVEGIAVDFDVSNRTLTLRKVVPTAPAASGKKTKAQSKPPRPINRTTHTYVPPPFDSDIVKILQDVVPHNLWFVGATGSGKTEYVHHLASRLGRRVFQINCRRDMETASFLGDKTVDIDESTGQNFIRFVEGTAISAMQEGLDDQGNEVGEPGILFIDEAGAVPSHISIALNRLLETRKARRTVTLDGDGGREVHSHSGFRIIMAANTIGRGLIGLNDSLYTAQGDAQDISTLNRITAVFHFGYNRVAEKNILAEKIGDARISQMILKFRDAIRDTIRQGDLQTPFSTRTIVAIADCYRIWGSIEKAVFYTIFNSVTPDEATKYNELWYTLHTKDLRAAFECKDMDY